MTLNGKETIQQEGKKKRENKRPSWATIKTTSSWCGMNVA